MRRWDSQEMISTSTEEIRISEQLLLFPHHTLHFVGDVEEVAIWRMRR